MCVAYDEFCRAYLFVIYRLAYKTYSKLFSEWSVSFAADRVAKVNERNLEARVGKRLGWPSSAD